jgi:predicted RNase H-like HicB family nuclease
LLYKRGSERNTESNPEASGPGGKEMRYTVILEKGPSAWGAYVPDLPGCAVIAETEEQAAALIREAIKLYLEDLRTRNLPTPPPASKATEVEVFA